MALTPRFCLQPLQIQNIKDLIPLASCKHLEFLSLRDAPVSRLPNYRSWLIFNCPTLRVIDFEKVKQKVCGAAVQPRVHRSWGVASLGAHPREISLPG